VSKHWKPGRQTVELRPSRIRREPVRIEPKVEPQSREREVWGAVAGVVLLAITCTALAVGFSTVTNFRGAAAADPAEAAFGHCYNHGGPNCVLDGDTVLINGEWVEIAGIDAPEIGAARCPEEASRGIDAAVRLVSLLNSGKVTVGGTDREPDGRLLRHVEVDGQDVGAAMIDAGVAREYGSGPLSWC
jgi:endonuclease YncB( thermonuclease family)